MTWKIKVTKNSVTIHRLSEPSNPFELMNVYLFMNECGRLFDLVLDKYNEEIGLERYEKSTVRYLIESVLKFYEECGYVRWYSVEYDLPNECEVTDLIKHQLFIQSAVSFVHEPSENKVRMDLKIPFKKLTREVTMTKQTCETCRFWIVSEIRCPHHLGPRYKDDKCTKWRPIEQTKKKDDCDCNDSLCDCNDCPSIWPFGGPSKCEVITHTVHTPDFASDIDRAYLNRLWDLINNVYGGK